MSHEETPHRLISIRPHAIADVERHADYLEENAAPDVAIRFRAAITDAIEQIAFMPGAGTPRKVRNTLLSGLRMAIVHKFRNYLIFYLSNENSVDIVRVFHGAQDINNLLEEED